MKKSPAFLLLVVASLLLLPALQAAPDPFAAYLDGKAPKIIREVPTPATATAVPANITVRRVVFRLRDNSEIYALIATPNTPGQHPGMLVLHGGGGNAEEEKALAWAQRGYIAVAPDLPGIANPEKIPNTKGRWNALKYGEGRWVATPDASASVIFDAVLSAMKSLYLLRSQPEVDTSRIGVVGISWGGYMTTMVCGLAGDHVKAGFAVFGCGFYDLTAQATTTMAKMVDDAERARWLEHLDPGRRAPGMKATFFLAGATNDFFYYPRAVQATLDAIPGEKNHLYAPNANHKIPLPGGTVFSAKSKEPFKPTAFQPYPTPSGNKANWLEMEVPFFDYYLSRIGQPLPKVTVEREVPNEDAHHVSFSVVTAQPLVKAEIYWAKANPDVMKREWLPLAVTQARENYYEATLPADAVDWFAVVSDGRPVTVSSALMQVSH